jgi:hydroxyacylglutathione hydrolase
MTGSGRSINHRKSMLIFEQIHTPGIALLSYLIGDDSTGMAAVIDPRPDVDVYLELAREHRVGITHIFETHIHADFMSGALELQGRICAAKIFASSEGGARYGFACQPLKDGDRFELGDVVLEARHTPGHTPEHMSFLVYEAATPDSPWGVFSGDSLFVDSVGRPDLLGSGETEQLAGQLYQTVTGFYRGLDDGVLLFPGHGSGSSCGPDIGDRKSSSLGYEKQHNPYLRDQSREEFVKAVLESAPPEPHYYKPMKKVNAAGPETFGHLPCVPPLPVRRFKEAIKEKGHVLVDTRNMLAFGGGHIQGALNIGDRPELSPWAGWMLKFEDPILLVLEKDQDLEGVVRLLWRTGYTHFAGYLVGGMKAWDNAGLPIQELPQLSVHELKNALDDFQVLDVRTPSEWESGHIPTARHMFVPEVRERAGTLDRNRPIATYCDSGYRASIAASVLQQEGFAKAHNVPGSWQAWTKAGFPVANGKD